MPTSRRIVGLLLSAATALPAPAIECDQLTPDLGDLGFKYRHNGDRCEGFFRTDVASSSALAIAYLSVGVLPGGSTVAMLRALDPALKIRVRAVPRPLGTRYRMDAALEPGQVLRWPLEEVLATGLLSPAELGVFGWIDDPASKIRTYVPVLISALGQLGPSGRPRLGIRANVRLENFGFRTSSGPDCKFDRPYQRLLDGRVNSGQVVAVPMPEAKAFCIAVKAQLEGSDDPELLTIPVSL